MNFFNRLLLLLSLAFSLNGFSQESRVLITSIPKSGTHLLGKTIEKITRTPIGNSDIHHTYDRVVHFAKTHPETPILLIVRDLRDVSISYVHHLTNQIKRHPEPPFYYLFGETRRSNELLAKLIPQWGRISFEEKLTAVLEANDLAPCDIDGFFRVAMELSELPNTVLLKFENIIGPKGGGDLELQYKEIRKIAEVYQVKLTDARVKEIAADLFGPVASGSRWNVTFRKGKIGEWKNIFNQHQIEVFKKRFNEYLYHFGYIENDDW